MSLTPAAFRSDKRCGKSGIPDRAKCTKQTSAKATPGPELKERAFAVSTAVQGARAARSYLQGRKGAALKQLMSAGKNASEYAQERGERTGNKRLLAFATGKNLIESANAVREARSSIATGNWQSAAFNIAEAGNTALESYTFNRQRQGKRLKGWEEENRNFGDLLQASKWVSAANNTYRERSPRTRKPARRSMTKKPVYRGYKRSLLDSLTAGDFRDDACWKGYVQAGTKRKGNRTVPNCIPAGKRKKNLKKAGLDGEDKLTNAKRSVWADGYAPKKMKARR